MGGVLIFGGLALAIGGVVVWFATYMMKDPRLALWCKRAAWGGVVLAAAGAMIKLAEALL